MRRWRRIYTVRDAFVKPANNHFPPYWKKTDETFAQPWAYATAGFLWGNPPFSRLEEVVKKAARGAATCNCFATEWPGPNYQWLASLC